MDFENCCRICLECKKGYLDLEEIYDEEQQLSNRDILELVTKIDLFAQDSDCPMQICFSCGEELQICYNFQKKVEYSNNLLKSVHSKNQEDETYLSISYLKEEEEEEIESKEVDAISSDNDFKSEQITFELVRLAAEDNEEPTENTQDLEENLESEADSIQLSICKSPDSSPVRSEDRFECTNCYKKFANQKRLSTHLISHNPNRPRFPCTGCSRVYVTKQALQIHVLTVHKKKGHKCKFCDKIFAIHKGLIIHMRYHTGDFPYECDQCERKFAQLCHLKTHINVKHKNARFTCEYANCNKFFTNSASLRNHEFTHGTMPFTCEFCNKGYPAKSKLKVHIRRKHGTEISIDELERMRVFHVPRTPLKLVELEKFMS